MTETTMSNGMLLIGLVTLAFAAIIAWWWCQRLQAAAVERVAQKDGNVRPHCGRDHNPQHVLHNSQVWLIGLSVVGALCALAELYVAWHTFGGMIGRNLGAVGPLLGLIVAGAGVAMIAILMHHVFEAIEWYSHRAKTRDSVRAERLGIESDKVQTVLRRVWQQVLPRFADNPGRMQEVRRRAAEYVSSTVPAVAIPREWLRGSVGDALNGSADDEFCIDDDLSEEVRGRQAQLRHSVVSIVTLSFFYIAYWVTYFSGVSAGTQAQLEQKYSQEHQAAYLQALEVSENSQSISLNGAGRLHNVAGPQVADYQVSERELLTARRSAQSTASIILLLQLLLGTAIGLVLVKHEHAATDVARMRYWTLLANREAQRFEQSLGHGEGTETILV